ncbi:hypothetical protein D3C72_1399810 [compost metagenome]
MLHDDIFNFVGIDVEAGDENHVFLTIDDTQESFVIHHRDITRVQPAAFHDFISGVRSLPVT